MYFVQEVKAELTRVKDVDECCLRAELDALLKLGAEIVDRHFDFTTTSAAVARRLLKLFKKIYPGAHTEIGVIRIKNYRKRYLVRIFLTPLTKALEDNFNSNELPKRACCQAAYLRGAFLADGTVSRPETNYHLEIATQTERQATFIKRLMNRIDLPARDFRRKDEYVVYLKDFDSIVDFLAIIGADNGVERCEIAKNVKEVRCQVNRLINCELASYQKSLIKSKQQLDDIKFLRERGISMSKELETTADLRLENPDMTMIEMAPLLNVSYSAVKERMKRIRVIASRERSPIE